jgi:hypothetical protein
MPFLDFKMYSSIVMYDKLLEPEDYMMNVDVPTSATTTPTKPAKVEKKIKEVSFEEAEAISTKVGEAAFALLKTTNPAAYAEMVYHIKCDAVWWANKLIETKNVIDYGAWLHYVRWTKRMHTTSSTLIVAILDKGAVPFATTADLEASAARNEERMKHLAKIIAFRDATVFDGKKYWRRDHKGCFVSETDRQLMLFMETQMGIPWDNPKNEDGEPMEEIEYPTRNEVVGHINAYNRVDSIRYELFRPDGKQPFSRVKDVNKVIFNMANKRVMQPSAAPGDFKDVQDLLEGLFGDKQLDYFLAWVKRMYMDRYNLKPRPCQLLVVAGPPNSGKSFLGEHFFDTILSGDSFSIKQMLAGDNFNSTEMCAPIWFCDDLYVEYDKREEHTSVINNLICEPAKVVEGKGADKTKAYNCTPIVIFCNMTERGLSVIPKYDEDMAGKMLLFKVTPFNVTEGMSERLITQLPAFLQWLMNWTPPKHTEGTYRFGVAPYAHESLIIDGRMDASNATIEDLLNYYMDCLGWVVGDSQIYRPSDLLTEMSSLDKMKALLKDLSHEKLGKGLRKLAEAQPAMVQETKTRDGRVYKITRI